MSATIKLRIYSPRLEGENTYNVILDSNFMEISVRDKITKATLEQGSDPIWSDELFEHLIKKESIHLPAKVKTLFENVWKGWREGKISDHEVEKELNLIAERINTITRSQQKKHYWKKYF